MTVPEPGFFRLRFYPRVISETVTIGKDAGNNLDPERRCWNANQLRT